ncbi:hypothetical protein BH10ACI1_BH10ACI1_28720 [soil metagenome]
MLCEKNVGEKVFYLPAKHTKESKKSVNKFIFRMFRMIRRQKSIFHLRIDTRQTKVLEVRCRRKECVRHIFFNNNGKKFSYRRIAGKGENHQ